MILNIFFLHILIFTILQKSQCFSIFNSNLFNYLQDNAVNTRNFFEFNDNVESVLPNDIVVKIDEIKSNSSLSTQKKNEEVNKIMTLLPQEIVNKIPTTDELNSFSKDVKEELQRIMDNKHLSITERRMEIAEIVEKNLNLVRNNKKTSK